MKFGKNKHYDSGIGYFYKKTISKQEKQTITMYNKLIIEAKSGLHFENMMKKIDDDFDNPSKMKAIFNSLFYPLNKYHLKKGIKDGMMKNLFYKQFFIRRCLGYISHDDYYNFLRKE